MQEKNTKQTVIELIISDMIDLPLDMRERLKLSLIFRLKDYELIPKETLPAVSTYDNEHVMEQFATAKLAENREISSIQNYLYHLKTFYAHTGLLWSDVTGSDVAEYLAIKRIRDHSSDSYLVSIQKALCSFYGWLFQRKYIGRDLRDEIPRPHAVQKQKKRLTDDEVEACRNVAKDGYERALLELMLSTGIRVGEIANLDIEHLDFDKREIRIYGEKTNLWRTVFMNPQCKIHLLHYIGDRSSGPVFISRQKKRASRNTLESIASGISLRANCHIKATVHVYRKTFASILYRKTGDVLLVSKILGHLKTDTTIKYYLVDDIDEMKQKVMKTF